MNVPFLLIALVCALPGAAAGTQNGALTVYFEERAPYQVRVDDTIEGLVGTPAARAFKAARIEVIWEASSISRQLFLLRQNATPACVIGWFKTGERLQYAKYTKALYRDGPVVALVRTGFVPPPGPTMHDLLTAPGVRVLLRTGYVYGAHLDAVLKQTRPATVNSPLPNSQMIELLLANRADLMFATEEEAARLLLYLGPKAAGLQLHRFSDQVPSEPRYIACTGKVSDETIARINAAIADR